MKRSFAELHALNIDAILPTHESCFQQNGDLSPYGYRIYCNDLNLAFKCWDELQESGHVYTPKNLKRFQNKPAFFKKAKF